MLGSASALLTLPRFHPAIPVDPVIDEGQDHVSVFASSLVFAGILRTEHLDAHPRSLRKAIDHAVNQWLEPYHTQLHVFSTVSLGYTPDLVPEGNEECGTDEWRAGKPAAFVVSNGNVDRESYYIGEFATALQKKVPGLGHDLMRLLRVASTHGIGVLDPYDAYGMAQHSFWMGETDIIAVADNFRDPKADAQIKESGGEVPSDEELLEANDIPTPRQFFLEYPEWAVEFKRCCDYSRGPLSSFPKLSGKFRQVMAAANDLTDHLRFVRGRWLTDYRHNNNRRFPNDARRMNSVHNQLACPILLRWSYEDWHVRLLDDEYNGLMSCGDSCDINLTGAVCFDPQDDADCRDSRARFEALLTTGILTDRILQLTTTTDEHN